MVREYKDSGITWIGRIPQDWNTTKLGSLYTQRNEKVSDKDYAPLSVTMQGILPQLETAAKTDDGDNRKLVKKGDFAINSRSDRRGSCGISPYDGSVSLINTILKPRGEMNPNFYNWLFHTSPFADEFYKWGHGIVDDLWTTRWQEMKNISVVIPSLEEQQKISIFLDKKCSIIDSLISLQEQMMEQLTNYKLSVITEAVTKGLNDEVQFVSSGIEWIGDVPKHWDINKLFNLCTIKGRIGWKGLRSDEFKENSYAYLVTGQDFKSADIDWKKCYQIDKERYDEDPYIQLNEGDLLVTKDGSIGKIAKVGNLDKPACLNSGIFVLKQRKDIFYPNYLYWYLESPLLLRYNSFINTGGTTIIHLYQNVFERFTLLIPPMDEQQSIASYLDKKCGEIDKLLEIKKEKLEALKNYKKSVIFEAVTGKIKIY